MAQLQKAFAKTTKTSITRDEYLQLLGLKTLSKEYNKILDLLTNAVQRITGELDHNGNPEKSGHNSDFIFGDRELDDMLRILEIKVIE